jgi:hypothetical protein
LGLVVLKPRRSTHDCCGLKCLESDRDFRAVFRSRLNFGGKRRSGLVLVEATIVAEYLALRNLEVLDRSRYRVTESVIKTDIAKFEAMENGSAQPSRAEQEYT